MAAPSPDNMDYYVYILFRPNGLPFYVGKGRGRRWLHHEWYARRGTLTACASFIRKVLAEGSKEIPKIKVCENLTKFQAIEYEIAWIAAIGRKTKGGMLLNLTDGGDGRVGGDSPSLETRAKNSAAHLGKKRSEQARANIAVGNKGKGSTTENLLRMSKLGKLIGGTKNTPEVKAKIIASLIGNKRKLGFRDPPETIARKRAGQLRRHETNLKAEKSYPLQLTLL